MEKQKERALIAMSGGVDSSVSAFLMLEQGYECVGCTMRLYENDIVGMDLLDTCCSIKNTEDARSVTEKIGIPYHIFHYENLFKKEVIDYFVNSYEKGDTPNPCIECNRCFKFLHLFDKMEELDCDYIVTGHYSQIVYDENSGRYLLKKAVDTTKDQSYVLYMLTQEQLSKTKFPLGGLTKVEVREIAEKQGFVNSKKHDSQDICFVPDGDYVGFMERYTGKKYESGDFIDAEGNAIAKHRGAVRYTIGQRRGLGISAPEPLYVFDKNMEDNTVSVGSENLLFSTTLVASDVNFISIPSLDGPLKCKAKTRYRQKEQWATAYPYKDGKMKVVFDEPQRAITTGQAVVLYDEDIVIGGGTITSVEK